MAFDRIKEELKTQQEIQNQNLLNQKEAEKNYEINRSSLIQKGMPYLKQIEPHFWALAKEFKSLIKRQVLSTSKSLFGFITTENTGACNTPQFYIRYSKEKDPPVRITEIRLGIGNNCLTFFSSQGYSSNTICSHTSHISFIDLDKGIGSKWIEDQFEEFYQMFERERIKCEKSHKDAGRHRDADYLC